MDVTRVSLILRRPQNSYGGRLGEKREGDTPLKGEERPAGNMPTNEMGGARVVAAGRSRETTLVSRGGENHPSRGQHTNERQGKRLRPARSRPVGRRKQQVNRTIRRRIENNIVGKNDRARDKGEQERSMAGASRQRGARSIRAGVVGE